MEEDFWEGDDRDLGMIMVGGEEKGCKEDVA